MLSFIIVIFAIFVPMAAAEALKAAAACLPNWAVLGLLWAFLTTAGSYMYLRWEAAKK